MAQEEDGHGAGCSCMTPRMKTGEANVRALASEKLRRRARRAAGCRKMTRDRPMSMTNLGNGRKITSPKLLQVGGLQRKLGRKNSVSGQFAKVKDKK